MFQIQRKSEQRYKLPFSKVTGDVAGGATLSVADLTQSVLPAGTPVGVDTSTGLYHVVKCAVLTANASNAATTYTVKKGHNFKVGDVIMAVTNGKAYAITGIATNSGDNTSDDITVGTTLGVAVSSGAYIMQALTAGASGSAFKYTPKGMTTEPYDVEAGDNLLVNVALSGTVFKECVSLPDAVKNAIPNIIFF